MAFSLFLHSYFHSLPVHSLFIAPFHSSINRMQPDRALHFTESIHTIALPSAPGISIDHSSKYGRVRVPFSFRVSLQLIRIFHHQTVSDSIFYPDPRTSISLLSPTWGEKYAIWSSIHQRAKSTKATSTVLYLIKRGVNVTMGFPLAWSDKVFRLFQHCSGLSLLTA